LDLGAQNVDVPRTLKIVAWMVGVGGAGGAAVGPVSPQACIAWEPIVFGSANSGAASVAADEIRHVEAGAVDRGVKSGLC
jgi:hypothetical protein